MELGLNLLGRVEGMSKKDWKKTSSLTTLIALLHLVFENLDLQYIKKGWLN